MEGKKSIGFGGRGTILLLVLFLGFLTFQVFSNYSLNILADFYGGAQKVAMMMTLGTAIGLVLQILISSFISKIKSIKKVTAVIGALAIIFSWAEALIPNTMTSLWLIDYLLVNVFTTMYALFFLSIIAGQWFPTRKGTLMGIATIAFPFGNGVTGFFASTAMAPLATGGAPAVFQAFLPFLIVVSIGYILFMALVTDYPEQCGAFRDNDKNMTAEKAQQMMLAEIEAKKTTVWTMGHIFKTRDFWFASVSCGLLLMGAVGTMTQSSAIIANGSTLNYTIIMMVIAIFGAIGSWLLGVIDTAIGTKKAIVISEILMILAGALGIYAVPRQANVPLVISLILVAMFMGASSNFTVSVAAQYWRREDFSGVFACVNPIANIFNALAATVVAALLASPLSISGVFIFLAIAGIVGTILMLLFSGKHIKAVDDKYRQAAGKPMDDELANRK